LTFQSTLKLNSAKKEKGDKIKIQKFKEKKIHEYDKQWQSFLGEKNK
jgi:hypothetical protein